MLRREWMRFGLSLIFLTHPTVLKDKGNRTMKENPKV